MELRPVLRESFLRPSGLDAPLIVDEGPNRLRLEIPASNLVLATTAPTVVVT